MTRLFIEQNVIPGILTDNPTLGPPILEGQRVLVFPPGIVQGIAKDKGFPGYKTLGSSK